MKQTNSKAMRALISVSDKTGVVELARALASLDVAILSTGGTAKLLADNGWTPENLPVLVYGQSASVASRMLFEQFRAKVSAEIGVALAPLPVG